MKTKYRNKNYVLKIEKKTAKKFPNLIAVILYLLHQRLTLVARRTDVRIAFRSVPSTLPS
jgi:hypothetical protein